MKLNEIKDAEGATHSRKRLGRGIGSGTGKTGGRGVKGQNSRSGVAINGFEGGQMPIYRRLPKRGFTNFTQKFFNTVSVGRIQAAIDAKKLDPSVVITLSVLKASGIIRKAKDGFRILSDGELTSKISIVADGASKVAVEKIEKAGGTVALPAVSTVD